MFDALLPDGQNIKYTLQSFVNEEGFFEAISNDVYCRVPNSYTALRAALHDYTKKLIGFGRLVSMTKEQRLEIQQRERASQQVYEASLLREFRHKMIRMIAAKQISTEEAQRRTVHFRSTLTSLVPTAEERRAAAAASPDHNATTSCGHLPAVVTPDSVSSPPAREYSRKSHLDLMKNSDVSTMTPVSSLRRQF